jgi:hypothetical protein
MISQRMENELKEGGETKNIQAGAQENFIGVEP